MDLWWTISLNTHPTASSGCYMHIFLVTKQVTCWSFLFSFQNVHIGVGAILYYMYSNTYGPQWPGDLHCVLKFMGKMAIMTPPPPVPIHPLNLYLSFKQIPLHSIPLFSLLLRIPSFSFLAALLPGSDFYSGKIAFSISASLIMSPAKGVMPLEY